MLSGSEKLADGGEVNGGGNGRGVRFAKRETPVSKRKGSRADVVRSENSLRESCRLPHALLNDVELRVKATSTSGFECNGRIPTVGAADGRPAKRCYPWRKRVGMKWPFGDGGCIGMRWEQLARGGGPIRWPSGLGWRRMVQGLGGWDVPVPVYDT